MVSSDKSQISVLIDDICILRKSISIQREFLEIERENLGLERARLVVGRTSTEQLIELWKPLAKASHAYGGSQEYRAIAQLTGLALEAEYDIQRVELAKAQIGREMTHIDRTLTWAQKTEKLLRDYLYEHGWNGPFTTLAVDSLVPTDPVSLALTDFPPFDPEKPSKWRDLVIGLVFPSGADEEAGGNGTEGNGGDAPKEDGSGDGSNAPKGGGSGNGGDRPANGSDSGGADAPTGGSVPLPEDVIRRLQPILERLFREFWRRVKATQRRLEREAVERDREAKRRETETRDRETREADRQEKEAYELDKERERRQTEADEDAHHKRRGERRQREGEREPGPEREGPDRAERDEGEPEGPRGETEMPR